MSLYYPLRGGSLLITSGPDNNSETKHLFVLLTNPFDDDGQGVKRVLLVPLCSVRHGKFVDKTCIFIPKDKVHPFIIRDSFINYRLARIEEADSLMRGVNDGTFIHKESIEEGFVSQICEGLRRSPHTAQKHVIFIDKYESEEE